MKHADPISVCLLAVMLTLSGCTVPKAPAAISGGGEEEAVCLQKQEVGVEADRFPSTAPVESAVPVLTPKAEPAPSFQAVDIPKETTAPQTEPERTSLVLRELRVKPTEAPVSLPKAVTAGSPAEKTPVPTETMKALSEPESLATTEPQPTAHIHVWVEETEMIHYEAVKEQVWVVDAEAWDQPIYETVPTFTCACGAVFYTSEERMQHSLQFDLEASAAHSHWSNTTEQRVVGYKHWDEEGHWEERTLEPAYDETRLIRRCACGAES